MAHRERVRAALTAFLEEHGAEPANSVSNTELAYYFGSGLTPAQVGRVGRRGGSIVLCLNDSEPPDHGVYIATYGKGMWSVRRPA